ncbi:MAG TPA: response regulator transcription factor [Actinomycetota bacterium]|nr:response regulator transcription factor [Actinomycetota bacterium]
MRVVVVDDQELVRAGFRMILGASADIDVVDECGDGRAAIEAVRRWRPDVVLMDIRMPELDGLAATEIIMREMDPPPRVLILTTFDADEYVYRALRAGASGFVLKDIPPPELVAAIRTIASGDALLAPAITSRLVARFAHQLQIESQRPPELELLTERELEVLRAVADGSTNSEIADRLHVSPTTVKTHVSSVLAKLGLRDRVQAVVYAYEHGVVTPGGQRGSST